MGIVGSAVAGNFSQIHPGIFLEPILNLVTSVPYIAIAAAATIAERHKRIATLAAFLATSAAAVSLNPTTNLAIGGTVVSKMGYMKAILSRGGSDSYRLTKSISSSLLKDFVINVDSLRTSGLKIHPYRIEFTDNSKLIINLASRTPFNYRSRFFVRGRKTIYV